MLYIGRVYKDSGGDNNLVFCFYATVILWNKKIITEGKYLRNLIKIVNKNNNKEHTFNYNFKL